MSGALRRRAMLAIVVLVLIWPIAHAGLVARYRLDAWEFFGWSMYALPAARVQVRVDVVRDGETVPLRAMGAMRRRIMAFARRATVLGSLASTEPLAWEIMQADSTIQEVSIVTREVLLDRESSMLVTSEEEHRHDRSDMPGDDA